jgi:Ser/Thr protein kinase RdoA (MazF antagonist)
MEAGKLLSDLSLDRAKSTPFFSTVHSTLAASDLLKEVGREYGIGMPTHCRLLRTKINDTYVIQIANARYLLRVYRTRWRSLPEIAYEMELLLHLHKKGIEVMTPLPRRDGGLVGAIRAPEGIRYTVLFTSVPGTALGGLPDVEHAQLFGQSMATFHRAADDFSSPHGRRPLDLAFLLDEPLQALQPLLTHRLEDWQRLLRFAEKMRAGLNALDLKHLSWGPCHGGPLSMNVGKSGKIAENQDLHLTLLNFDFCGPGWRAYDLAGGYGVACTQNNSTFWEQFLRGYREVRPLSEVDELAIPFFGAIRLLWWEGLQAANGNEWGFEGLDDEHFDRLLCDLQKREEFEGRLRSLPK